MESFDKKKQAFFVRLESFCNVSEYSSLDQEIFCVWL